MTNDPMIDALAQVGCEEHYYEDDYKEYCKECGATRCGECGKCQCPSCPTNKLDKSSGYDTVLSTMKEDSNG